MTFDLRDELKRMSCFIQETNIPQFVYKLHTLFGDCQGMITNLDMLAAGTSSDYIAVMNEGCVSMKEAHMAFCRFSEFYHMLLDPDNQGAYLFAIHINQTQDKHGTGSVLLMDMTRLREHIQDHGVLPIGVTAVRSSGRKANIPLERWYRLGRADREKLESWEYQYSPAGIDAVKGYYSTALKSWQEAACPVEEGFMMDRFNEVYMAAAKAPQENMYRIPQMTATLAAIRGNVPVFRLLPDGPKELSPITAMATGFSFDSYCEFAIKQKDLNRLEPFIRQEAKRIMAAYLDQQPRKKRSKEPSL